MIRGNPHEFALALEAEQGEVGILDAAQLGIIRMGAHSGDGARHPDGIGQRRLCLLHGRGLATAQNNAQQQGPKEAFRKHEWLFTGSQKR